MAGSGARRPLALTMGDPSGVGPLATLACWRLRPPDARPFYIVASPDWMRTTSRNSGISTPIIPIGHPSEASGAFHSGLPVLGSGLALPDGLTIGAPDIGAAPAIVGSIRQAVADVQQGDAAAVVTNPMSKSLLMSAGFAHPGHTEFLSELSNPHAPPLPVMMLVGGGLRVALATIHRPLATVPGALSSDLLVEVGTIVAKDLSGRFGLTAPRIGICGLNPHAGESGRLGREEIEIINPASATLRASGIDASDARSADVIFHEMLGGRFDAIIAMYHDQGLIPVKTLDIWGGVNVTLGLPFIRTSPDHGTAYEAAAAGNVRHESLQAAIDLADQLATSKASAP